MKNVILSAEIKPLAHCSMRHPSHAMRAKHLRRRSRLGGRARVPMIGCKRLTQPPYFGSQRTHSIGLGLVPKHPVTTLHVKKHEMTKIAEHPANTWGQAHF
eukprot:6383967-Amphidinium_carterae.1